MERRFIIIASTLLAICITTIHSLEEEKVTGSEIIVTEMKPLKKIENRTPSNSTSTFPETHTVIHQGNNLYIKPKFFFGSQFTSYKQGGESNNGCVNMSVASKVPDEETNIAIGPPPIQQVPTVVVPPVITPFIEDDILIPPPRLPVQLQPPFLVPYPCQNMLMLNVPNDDIPVPCLPVISPIPPQLSRFPIVQNPVRPIVIPKPPTLPPLVLPKLPIEVLVKTPIFPPDPPVIRPIPDQPVIVPPVCPLMVKCTPPRQVLPSIPDIFSAIFEKFQRLLDLPSRIDFTSVLISDERETENDFMPDLVFPTMCAQGIIAERVVPNIVKNDEVKVIISPIFPSQSNSYRK